MFNLSEPQAPKNPQERYILSAHIDHCLAKGHDIHPENQKYRTLSEAKENTLSLPVNPKGKAFSWSYTALNAFENCPRAYAEERFFGNVKFIESEAIRDGNRGHACAEDLLLGKTPKDPVYLEELRPYVDAFRKAQDSGAELLVEHEIALSEAMKPVSWFAKTAWFRGKLDVVSIKGGRATVGDWKMGKVKDNPDQLKIFAASLSIVRPDIEVFLPKFIFPKQKEVVGCGEIHKDQVPGIWASILQRVRRMEDSWRSGVFPARPGGLCKWATGQCASYNTCPYARGK